MLRTRSFPWLIVCLVAVFLAMTAWSLYRAVQGSSAVTDADYYSHGLRYNQTMLEQKAAATQGWEAVPSLKGRLVTVELRDQERRAVAGARGELTLLDPVHPGTRRLALHEDKPGIYRAEVPVDLQGEQSVELSFQCNGARMTRRLLLSLN